ncbi:4-hydroxybenzoate octaprenyltransferase [Marinivivus vitaminiproducens]|uniref:4-hydroxybenzoate octaprenyltransferase n=1 Tax=Marinivivus vitaminiproducens TaxID=3035935 RepID=UPI0027AB01AD|nr:4-hydroxybenzoate octaprenyltransferase [Geminicoccaceae bacterium SCSIO 64248]
MARQGSPRADLIADRQIGWIGRLPAWIRPYAELARWDRPIGTWLLLWPCWWALALVGPLPDPVLLVLFGIGAIAMRGAGCAINDLADRDFDRRVARTRQRPLASGRLRPRDALAFLALQLLAGLVVLLVMPPIAIVLGFLIMPVVVAYPFMKRITYWPQAFLAICFNWGAVVGYAAATGHLALPALTLYLAGMAWTMGYDTIYAHQDKEDDALIGVRSTALLFGANTRPWVIGFYAAMLAMLVLTGALAGLGLLFYLGLVAVAWALWRQIRGLDFDDTAGCLAAFRANRLVGLLVALAFMLGHLRF